MRLDRTVSVDVERIIPILEQSIERSHYQLDSRSSAIGGGLKNTAFYCSMNEKVVSDIIHRRRKSISVTTLDKILTGLHLEYLSQWPEDDGGFKDVFDRLATSTPPKKKKYTYRPKPKCPCPKCGKPKGVYAETCADCRYPKSNRRRTCKECKKKLAHDGRRNKTGFCLDCLNRKGGAYYASESASTRTGPEWNKKTKYIIEHGRGYGGRD